METIAIIGGGASGFMAAVSAAQVLKENKIKDTNIVILERLDRVGKKILATGNGKCNLTNINADINYYHSQNPEFVKEILTQFKAEDTIKFFKDIGMLCRIENDGKVYPHSNQSSTVLDVLRMESQHQKVQEVCNFEVKSITKKNKNFIITEKSGKQQTASKVIITTGGKSIPNLGANGSGYELLESLGHTCTNIFPALVQIKSSNPFAKVLNGIKVNGIATVINNGKTLDKKRGEILFTEYGLSGIVILELSRTVGECLIEAKNNINILLDIMPDFTEQTLISMLEERKNKHGWKTLENFLTGIVNKKVGQMVIKSSGITPLSKLAETLTKKDIINIVRTMKGWSFPSKETMSWNNAQVTAGGIKTDEFNPHTLESKLVNGLYVAGEVLDVDGDCGGFNLQWAWSTGFVAGSSAALKRENLK